MREPDEDDADAKDVPAATEQPPVKYCEWHEGKVCDGTFCADCGPQHDRGSEGRPSVVDVVRPFRRIPIDLRQPLPAIVTVGRYGYRGGLTTIIAEPEAGKSWIAADEARKQIDAGHPVIYLDEEGGPDIIHERLSALGADPDAVAQGLHYFAFEGRRWHDEDLLSLDALIASVPGCTLAVFDSLPDFLAAAGRSEDSAQDVTTFVNTVLRPFRDAGITQLLLDHLSKPSNDSRGKRGRYSRGSGAKLAKADVTILLESVEPFDATTSGKLHLWKTKDRRGRLDLPSLAKPPIELLVTVGDGSLTITETAPLERDEWDGPTECMAAVLGVLADVAPGDMSGARLITTMRALGHPFRDKTVREAAERLVVDGSLVAYPGRRGARIFRLTGTDDGREVALDEAF